MLEGAVLISAVRERVTRVSAGTLSPLRFAILPFRLLCYTDPLYASNGRADEDDKAEVCGEEERRVEKCTLKFCAVAHLKQGRGNARAFMLARWLSRFYPISVTTGRLPNTRGTWWRVIHPVRTMHVHTAGELEIMTPLWPLDELDM